MIVDIGSYSEKGLTAAVNSNLLIDLLNELQGGDILLQLTCLETVKKLAVTDHGFEFLKKKRLLEYVNNRLNNPNEPLSALLIPGEYVIE